MPAVGPWRKASAAVSAPARVRVPFTSRRRLRAAPAASARYAPLGWRRPRNEPPSALGAGMRNRGEVAGGRAGVGVHKPIGSVAPPPGSQIPNVPLSERITDGKAHLFV